MMKNF